MPSYKLYYFNAYGRAELIRWIFEAGNIDYEDVRFTRDQWINEYKSKSPLGQCPWLEVDGEQIAITTAIARFVAKKAGLAGKDDLEQVRVDMVAGVVDDFVSQLIQFRFAPDEKTKEERGNKLRDETAPNTLATFDKLLNKNGSGDGYFVGDELTWCDIHFALVLGWLRALEGAEEIIQKFPKLTALEERVKAQPKIAAWIEKRPVTEF